MDNSHKVELLCAQIVELQAQEKELLAEKAMFDALSPEKKLATRLHSRLCGSLSRAECGWHYETDWLGFEHDVWHKRATRLIELVGSPDKVLDVIDIARGGK